MDPETQRKIDVQRRIAGRRDLTERGARNSVRGSSAREQCPAHAAASARSLNEAPTTSAPCAFGRTTVRTTTMPTTCAAARTTQRHGGAPELQPNRSEQRARPPARTRSARRRAIATRNDSSVLRFRSSERSHDWREEQYGRCRDDSPRQERGGRGAGGAGMSKEQLQPSMSHLRQMNAPFMLRRCEGSGWPQRGHISVVESAVVPRGDGTGRGEARRTVHARSSLRRLVVARHSSRARSESQKGQRG
jgi:hypothetical protein